MLQQIEDVGTWLYPARWLFYLSIVPGLFNSLVLNTTSARVGGELGFHLYMAPLVLLWFGLGFSSWVHWFARHPGTSDERPRARRVYRIALLYALVSTALLLGLAAFTGYAYVAMSLALYR